MRPETRIVLPVFAAVPLVILTATIACTWAIAHGASMAWRSLFRVFCHGIPSRCLMMWNVPMPICARCFAIYVGMFAGLFSFFVLPWIQERVMRVVLYVAVTPLAIDGITQALRLRESTNGLRMATGIAAGLAFGWWVMSALERREVRREVEGFTIP
jgi:uncharacterized membrane protein